MALSWNEIKDRAFRFSTEWADTVHEDADAQSPDRSDRTGSLRRVGDALQRRLQFGSAHAIGILDRDVSPVQRERDIAAIVRRAGELRLQVLVDGVADVFLQGIGGVSVQRAQPLERVGDVELNPDALRHGRLAGV